MEDIQANGGCGLFFAHTHWDAHLPRMISCWNFLLLDVTGFTGKMFDKHVGIGIDEKHFTRRIELLSETIDENFAGAKAELAKQKANELGMIFHWKIRNDATKFGKSVSIIIERVHNFTG